MRGLDNVIERRAKSRFGIRRELRYKVLEENKVVEAGTGYTLNMGSGGVAFHADRYLKPGSYIELSISWPVLLEESCPMRLSVLGRVLRSEGNRSACTTDKYEFRTQARQASPTAAGRSDTVLRRWAECVERENLKVRTANANA